MERESAVKIEVLPENQCQCLFVHIYYLKEDQAETVTMEDDDQLLEL
jgi:hypothetical protein